MNRPDDHEAKMARADLFKLAQYSFKLFKMIGENQELEGWVQAKITKAADYISSVYHYMQYEMKVSEYGDHLENAEMYSESIRRAYEQKLMEAKRMKEKAKANMLKKEKELDENMAVPQNPDGATAPPPKGKDGQYPIVTSGPNKGKRWSPKTPGPTNPAMKEEADRKPAKKSEREVELPSGAKVKATKVQGWQSQKADKDADKERKDHDKIKEGAKPDFLDMDKDGNKKEPMKKAVADKKKGAVKEASGKCNHTPKGKSCPVHGLKECGSMYEASHQAKTTMKHVKDPTPGEKKAAKDIKPGIKGYSDRVAMLKSAEKDGRLGEAKNLKQQAAIAIAKKKAK